MKTEIDASNNFLPKDQPEWIANAVPPKTTEEVICTKCKAIGAAYKIAKDEYKRKPLTGEVVVIAAQSCLSPQQYDHFEALLENDQDAHNRLARAIEAAHGIKE